jgi:hypothetical protein
MNTDVANMVMRRNNLPFTIEQRIFDPSFEWTETIPTEIPHNARISELGGLPV